MSLRGLVLIKMISSAVVSLVTSSAWAEMSLTNVDIKNCAPSKGICFQVTAPTASAGSFRQIYVLHNLTLTIEGPKGRTERILSPTGYLDFDNNQLVLQEKTTKGALVEKVFNLNTVERKTFITK